MPAYPFSQRPTFSEFKQALEKQGCQFLTLNVQVSKQDSYPVPYFMREVGGEPLTAVAVFHDDERVEVSDIRRICQKLQLPTDIFGLDLTDFDESTN